MSFNSEFFISHVHYFIASNWTFNGLLPELNTTWIDHTVSIPWCFYKSCGQKIDKKYNSKKEMFYLLPHELPIDVIDSLIFISMMVHIVTLLILYGKSLNSNLSCTIHFSFLSRFIFNTLHTIIVSFVIIIL